MTNTTCWVPKPTHDVHTLTHALCMHAPRLPTHKSMCGCMLACVPVQGAKAAKMAEFEKRQAEAAEKQREKEKLMEAELERQEKERQVREAKRISAMQEAIRWVPWVSPPERLEIGNLFHHQLS